jgi:hypothetical protein
MSESTRSKAFRVFSAIAMTVVAIVFGAVDLMLFKESSKHLKEICKNPFGDTTILVLSIMSILAIAPAYIAYRFFRGSVSSNGRTLLPASFFIGVGVFFLLVDIVCAVYSPSELQHILTATLPISIIFIWVGLKLRRGKVATSDDKMLKEI